MIFYITCDYHEGGALGGISTIQVMQLQDGEGRDYTFLVGYEKRYLSFADLKEDMAAQLGVNASEIELEEI